jgi:hypothetical protein
MGRILTIFGKSRTGPSWFTRVLLLNVSSRPPLGSARSGNIPLAACRVAEPATQGTTLTSLLFANSRSLKGVMGQSESAGRSYGRLVFPLPRGCVAAMPLRRKLVDEDREIPSAGACSVLPYCPRHLSAQNNSLILDLVARITNDIHLPAFSWEG